MRAAIALLRRTPAFTAAAVGILALGIGATVAIFRFVSGVLLGPLAYAEAERLVQVRETATAAPLSVGA